MVDKYIVTFEELRTLALRVIAKVKVGCSDLADLTAIEVDRQVSALITESRKVVEKTEKTEESKID